MKFETLWITVRIEKNSTCKQKGEGFVIWLVVVLSIYVALAIFQPYRDLGAGENKRLCYRWRDIGTLSGRKSKMAELSSYDNLTP